MRAKNAPDLEPALLHLPSRLFVEVTSRCNLRCPMCVKQSGSAHGVDGDMAAETFAALEPTFPHVHALILNGIGEPLMYPRLEACIRAGKRAMPAGSWVGFQTNGHLLTPSRAASLLDAGLDRVFLSVDATSPELFRTVRGGGVLGHVERALAALAGAKRAQPGATLEVGAEFVLMRDNMNELPNLIRWLAERGVSRLVVSHMLPFSEDMANQPVFGINTDSSKLFYETWAAKARQEGLDLTNYFKVLWKYKKSPEEMRLIAFVHRMADQAAQDDIPFHMQNLTTEAADDDMQQAEEVFDRAERLAAASGLHLVLPALQPLSTHTCVAIKEGGMFVAWDGQVSPCHFLWRDFGCHLYGRKKYVAHKVFGDLPRESVEAIWNKPIYRQFREDVIRHKYPHCPSCNVYPCEDIDSMDFEYDCYGERVPCGDCLWSMGLLQCMGQEDDGVTLKERSALELAKVGQPLTGCRRLLAHG